MSALGSPLKAVNVRGLRIGVYDDNGYFPVSPAIRRAIREAASALQSAGCKVEEVTAPDTTEAMRLFYAMFTQDGGAHVKSVLAGSTADPRIKDLLMLASLPNALRPLLAWLYSLRGQRRVARVLPWAGRRSPAERAALAAARESLISRSQETHREVEALVCPPAPFPALPHGASKDVDLATFCYTAPFNVLAWPAGIVAATRVRREEESERPRSKDRVDATARQIDAGSEGLPAGVQVAARAGRDEVVLGVMEVLEAHFRTQSDYPATPVTPSGRG
jgi:fatty acid amide hydrolase